MNFDNLELTDEQKVALQVEIDKEISGLKEKNNQLIKEKRQEQEKTAEAALQVENARKAAQEAEEQRLANEGNFEEIRKMHEKQIAEITANAEKQTNDARNAVKELHKNTALQEALSLIHDDYKSVSKFMLSNMINVDYNETGEPSITYTHEGQEVAKNITEFKSWALTQDSFKRILNGVDSGGAGSISLKNNGNSKLTLTEKAILANKQNHR